MFARWPSARKFGFALATMVLAVPLTIVNGWFALGIPVGLVLSVLWWFDFAEELRASPPAGRVGRGLVLLTSLPQLLFGLVTLLVGLAMAAFAVWNMVVVRDVDAVLRGFGALGMAALLALFGLGWLRSALWGDGTKPDTRFEAAWTLRRDEFGVSVLWPKGERQAIEWQAVETVAIETNDSGPWGADVWTVLEGGGERVLWPQGATGEEGMLTEMQVRFSGFDDSAVIAAMGCTQNARFVCWQKQA